jgi:hypothetical protein
MPPWQRHSAQHPYASAFIHPAHTFARKYTVIIEADGASPDQLTAARRAQCQEPGGESSTTHGSRAARDSQLRAA